jgi:hypothetical protein
MEQGEEIQWQWIIKRDLGENDLSRELNTLTRNGTEIFQVLPTPRGNGCRFLIVARKRPAGQDQNSISDD